MGGGTKNVDSAGAAQAKATDQAVQAQQMKIAADQSSKQNALYQTLFGNGTAGGGGTLSSFLDPNSLNVTKPTGVYERQMQEANQTTANDAANERASQARSMASRGFGSAPTMFGADQERQSRLQAADAKGANYTNAVGNQYKDALSNFWNATDKAQNTMVGSGSQAMQGYGGAGSEAGQMYGVGMQQKPNSNLLGNVISGGAQVGAAAMMCPASGSLITLPDGSKKRVEEFYKGDEVLGIDGQPCTLTDDPIPSLWDCLEVETEEQLGKVSIDHTFALVGGGYDYAKSIAGKFIKAESGTARVKEVRAIEQQIVYFLPLDGSHTYCADGLWALA